MMKSKDFIKNILKFCGPSVASAIIGIAVLPIVSRIYPETEYGYISNFYSIGNLLMSAVLLGMDYAYMRFYNDAKDQAEKNGLFVFCLKVGIVVTMALFALGFVVGSERITVFLFNDSGKFCFLMFGFYTIELVFFRMFALNMRMCENARGYSLQQICFILGNRLLFVIAAFVSTRYIYSAAVMILATAAVVVLSMCYQKEVFRRKTIPTIQIKKDMFRYGIPFMPTMIIGLLNSSVSKLVLGGNGMRAEVGVFAIATTVANMFALIPNGFSVYWAAFMYKNFETEKKMIRKMHDVIMLLSIVIVVGIMVFQDIMYWMLGVGYRASKPYFMLIMLNPITQLLTETTGYGVTLSKKTGHVLTISLITCTINVAMCYLLIPKYSDLGAALAIATSVSIGFIIRTIVSQRYYESIANSKRTVCGSFVLWGLCIANVRVYGNLSLRIVLCAIGLLITALLYRNSLSVLCKNAIYIVKGRIREI